MLSPDRTKPLLIFLASGVQGGASAKAALACGWRVRALVRKRTVATVEALSGCELFEADLEHAQSLRAACAGVDHAILQIPIGPLEAMKRQAANALAAFRAAGLRSFVLKLASASRPAPCEEPSFVANHMIEEIARDSDLPFATVWPTMYLDNLLKPSALAEILEQGVFSPPLPQAQRIAWTSADDCARAALMLLERGAMGGNHRIAGPDSLPGDGLMACVSLALGRTFLYRTQPLDAFGREVDAAMGSGTGRRVASKFRYFAAHPAEADVILARPFEPERGLDGFTPMDVSSWVRAHRKAFQGARR